MPENGNGGKISVNTVIQYLILLGMIISATLFISDRPTRSEVESKDQAMEQRMEKRLERIEAKLDKLLER